VLTTYAIALPAYVATELITRGLIALRDTRTHALHQFLAARRPHRHPYRGHRPGRRHRRTGRFRHHRHPGDDRTGTVLLIKLRKRMKPKGDKPIMARYGLM
jgi:hypothetical protein